MLHCISTYISVYLGHWVYTSNFMWCMCGLYFISESFTSRLRTHDAVYSGRIVRTTIKTCAIVYLDASKSYLLNVDPVILHSYTTQRVKFCQYMILHNSVFFSLTPQTATKLRGPSFSINIVCLNPWWRMSDMEWNVTILIYHSHHIQLEPT